MLMMEKKFLSCFVHVSEALRMLLMVLAGITKFKTNLQSTFFFKYLDCGNASPANVK
jgi:hypothetical protein